jgi:spore coat protein H
MLRFRGFNIGRHISTQLIVLGVIASSLPLAAADESNSLFPTNRLIEVRVIMDPADWDTMRREHHDLFTGVAPESGPRPSPYNYYKGTVIIEGERLENVGIRKKGFLGSASAHRPSLKFNFGKFSKGREFRDIELMTLNNNDQDASQLKQYLAYKLFNEAGVESPRCSLARVTVNGKYLGVYSHVESVNKQFVKRRFASGKGNLYEGQGVDFREGLSSPTF